MRLVSIHTYPIKGCYRLDHDRAWVEPWGLLGDRRWVVADPATGRVITQRDVTALTGVRPAGDTDLVVRASGRPDLRVARPRAGEPVEVSFGFSDFVGLGASAGAEAAQWFTATLGRPATLVWLDDPTRRPVKPAFAEPGDSVSFADSFPVTVASLDSLAALNDLIAAGPDGDSDGAGDAALPMTRFRPNLVVEGGPAWVEDEWIGRRLQVGGMTFRAARPAGRCVVTTTDQETGERGKQPLRALAQHRNSDRGLLFAVHLIPDRPGEIAVGDWVRPV